MWVVSWLAGVRLLSTVGHRVGLVQDDHLVLARRQRHLLLRKRLDAVSHHVDAALVGRVQLEHALLEGVTQQRSGKGQHAGRLARTRGPGQNEVGHVALLRQHLEPTDCLLVAHNVLDLPWAVLLEPLPPRSKGTRLT